MYSGQWIVSSMKCAVYTVNCALYTVHCLLYTVHCELCTVHCTLCSVQCGCVVCLSGNAESQPLIVPQLSAAHLVVHCTFYTIHCTIYTLHSTVYSANLMYSIVYIVERPVHSVHSRTSCWRSGEITLRLIDSLTENRRQYSGQTCYCTRQGRTLDCTVLHCNALQYTTLHCSILHCGIWQYSTPNCSILHCSTLHYNTLP